MTEETPVESSSARWSATDVLGVINVFERMLLAMESRLVAKIDDTSRLASERWTQHDAQVAANEKRIAARFEEIEKSQLVFERSLRDHLQREEREDIVNEARIKPLVGSLSWVWKNWRDIVLLIIGIIAAGTFVVDALTRWQVVK